MSVTSGMVGHGFYNRHSAPQMAAIEHVLPWLDTAAGGMDFAAVPTTIALADFGCSEGHNSIAVMKRLVDTVRAQSDRPILTIHSDLPSNDFSGLFTELRGQGGSVFGNARVFSSAVCGSMFEQLLPPASVHFATTFNAIGFLSRRPLERLPGYILPNGPSQRGGIGYVADDERAICATQASADLEAFLRARGRTAICRNASWSSGGLPARARPNSSRVASCWFRYSAPGTSSGPATASTTCSTMPYSRCWPMA